MAIVVRDLNREVFAPFGDVIEAGAGTLIPINDGTTVRHDDLARVDVATEGGRPLISIFESRPFGFPLEIRMVERHPLGSQAFVPLDGKPYLVIVAPPGDAVDLGALRVFRATGEQGVNFHRGVWHHPVVVIEPMRFLVVDRGGDQPNCDLFHFPSDGQPLVVESPDG